MVRILNPGGFAINWHKTPPRTLTLPLKANPPRELLYFELGPEGPLPIARATNLHPHPGLTQAATLLEGGLSYPQSYKLLYSSIISGPQTIKGGGEAAGHAQTPVCGVCGL